MLCNKRDEWQGPRQFFRVFEPIGDAINGSGAPIGWEIIRANGHHVGQAAIVEPPGTLRMGGRLSWSASILFSSHRLGRSGDGERGQRSTLRVIARVDLESLESQHTSSLVASSMVGTEETGESTRADDALSIVGLRRGSTSLTAQPCVRQRSGLSRNGRRSNGERRSRQKSAMVRQLERDRVKGPVVQGARIAALCLGGASRAGFE